MKPWQVKEWVIPQADAAFVCAMEAVLEVYERPYGSPTWMNLLFN